jgi:hypothetical protein
MFSFTAIAGFYLKHNYSCLVKKKKQPYCLQNSTFFSALETQYLKSKNSKSCKTQKQAAAHA